MKEKDKRRKHPVPKPGDIYATKISSDVEVVLYNSYNDVDIVFIHTGYVTKTTAQQLRTGSIKDPHSPSVYGIGFTGEGEYTSVKDGVISPAWWSWRGMLQRTNDKSRATLLAKPTYANATVAEEWHNFQNFAEWYYNNIFGDFDKPSVDKDLLVKGNKHYSPDTCVIIPTEVNTFLVGCDAARGDLPKGVSRHGAGYRVQCTLSGKHYSGRVKYSVEDAFNEYKTVKESHAKLLAEKWKSQICPRAYKALKNYTVEITD